MIKINTKITIIIILIVSIFILIIINYNKHNTRKNIPVTQNIPKSDLNNYANTQFNTKVNFIGDTTHLPSKIKVYKTKIDTQFTKENINNFIKNLGFDINNLITSYGNNGTSYIYNKDNIIIFFYPNPRHIDYLNQSTISQNHTIEAISTYKNKIYQFLQAYIKDNNYQEISFNFINLSNSQEIYSLQTDFDHANAILAEFTYLIDDIPIFSKKTLSPLIRIYQNIDTSIRKAEIQPKPDQIIIDSIANLESIDNTLIKINKGQARIIQIQTISNPELEFSLSSLTKVTLNQVDLIYLYDYELQMLQPFYRFNGIAKTNLGEDIQIKVLINALPDEVFKQ